MELVFIRHGQSEWNAKNLFTGWRDVKLSEQGLAEAAAAGKKLKEKGYEFDIAFTSVLTRAIKTCNIVLEESDQLFVPQIKSWRLNERHYGQLQGMDKKQTAEKYGDEQVTSGAAATIPCLRCLILKTLTPPTTTAAMPTCLAMSYLMAKTSKLPSSASCLSGKTKSLRPS